MFIIQWLALNDKLRSWRSLDLSARVRPYSTTVKRENFILPSIDKAGKTVALIGWQVSCVMTSPAGIARLGLPNASDRSSDRYNLLNFEKNNIRSSL